MYISTPASVSNLELLSVGSATVLGNGDASTCVAGVWTDPFDVVPADGYVAPRESILMGTKLEWLTLPCRNYIPYKALSTPGSTYVHFEFRCSSIGAVAFFHSKRIYFFLFDSCGTIVYGFWTTVGIVYL